jgi:hypothetical protein
MRHRPRSAGNAHPHRCAVIEIRVAGLRQLFNAIDPSPFRQRDLDPRARNSSSTGRAIWRRTALVLGGALGPPGG